MNVTAPDGSLVTDVPDGTTKAQFLAKWNVGKGPQSSALGAFGRGAERGAIPAAGGFAGAGAGAEAGALAGALIPGLGETGLGEAGGAVVGGLAGAFGGGALAEKAQNYIGSKVPDIIKRAFGQDAPQQAADVKQHPYASFAGELAPNLAAMRPGAIAKAAEGAPRIVKALTHPITQRAVPAATFGGIEAGGEYADKGKIDPGKVAIAAGVGAVSNKPTRVGKALIGTGSKAAEAIERAFGIHAPVIETHRGTAEGAAAEKGQKAADLGADVEIGGQKVKPTAAPPAPKNLPALASSPKLPAKPPEGMVDPKKVTEWDDDANRLKTTDEANKLKAINFMKALPKDLPKGVWEQLSTEIEERLKNPDAKLSPEAQRAYDLGKSYEQSAIKNARWIKQYRATREIPEDDSDLDLGNLSDSSAGYVRRVVAGKGHVFDKFDPAQSWEGDPLRSTVSAPKPAASGKTSLSQSAPSLNPRQFYVLEKDGQSVFLHPGDKRLAQLQQAQQAGKMGSGERLRQATMQEVEQQNIIDSKTGEPIRYNKNWIANTIDNDLRLQRTRANIELLDKTVSDLDEQGAAYRARWAYKNKDGSLVEARNQKEKPQGWIETRIPQLRDYYFPPHEAKILDNIFSGTEDHFELLTKINRELARSLFTLPFKHMLNVTNDFYVSRGWDWINPMAYANLMKSGTRAMRALMTGNEDMQALLREGGSLRVPDTDERNFYGVLLKNAGVVMQRDEKNWLPFAKSIGFHSVKDMYDAILKQSGKAMWSYSNMLTMTKMFENAAKGMPMRQAVEDAERGLVNYRLPPQIMKQTWLPNLIKNPNVLWFGRYTYGKMRILANMGKDLLSPSSTLQQRTDAAGRWAALAAFQFFIAPYVLTAAYNKILGPGYQAARHGVTGVMQGLQNWMTQSDEKGWYDFVNQVVDLSPTIKGAVEFTTGKDTYGRDIVDPRASTLGRWVQRGEAAAGNFGPAQIAEQVAKPEGLKTFAAGQIGAEKKYTQPGWAARRERRAAGKREGKDPPTRAIRKLLHNIGINL